MADAQVEYKCVDLQSYEARNGASFAQSYKFSFPSMYRRLKSTRNSSVMSERKFETKAGSQNGAETPPEVKMALRMGVFDWAVSWSTLKSWSTFRIRLVLHEISWSTKDVSRNSGDIFREVNHVMALLRQLRRCSSRQVLQILINSK